MPHYFLLPLLTFSLISNFLPAQSEVFVDSRDGQSYAIVKMDSLFWFKNNLKYQTSLSHCPNYNRKKKDCRDGNYYAYQELKEVCPEGWRVAGLEDWEKYFELLKKEKGIDDAGFKYEKYPPPQYTVIVADTTNSWQLFDASNPLNLTALGWVQGRKVQQRRTVSYWAINEELKDSRYHLHIGPNKYVKHTHKHHIDDKPKKVRKFLVKCVSGSQSRE